MVQYVILLVGVRKGICPQKACGHEKNFALNTCRGLGWGAGRGQPTIKYLFCRRKFSSWLWEFWHWWSSAWIDSKCLSYSVIVIVSAESSLSQLLNHTISI